MKAPMKPHVSLLALLTYCGALGCVEVPAHARGRLAHPTMQTDYGHSPARAHVEAIHEGASGGTSLSSSGCGCN
jgi:hypothetical protein